MKKTLVFSLILLLSPLFVGAQVANNTSLVGTVTDSVGGVLVGAHVTAVNADTKVPYDAVTNAEGYYDITGQVNPGTYNITVEQAGYSKEQKTGVVLTLNLSVRTDFALKPGATSTEVTVSANTPAIQTDDSLLGETVTEKLIEDLPMNGRNALDLANTASNVSFGTGSALTGVPPGKGGTGNGSRSVNNSVTLDGISVMNNLGSTTTLQPNADALESVQTQNGNYTAQYGDYLGVHVNQSTKSGTNSLHGTAYDYIQNDALNSRGFNRSPTVPKKNALRYNIFGGVISGPVIVPFLYNGRDKTFFMASYEGLRTHTVTNAFSQAWTPAERTGDFSQLLSTATNGQSGKQVFLFSPFDGHPYFNGTSAATATSQVINDQPAANAPIVKNILSLAAAPNITAPGTLLTQNNYASTPSSTTDNSNMERIDENIGQKVRLFGRFIVQNVNGITTARDYVNNNYNPTYSRNGAAGYTQIITPNLVNDLRAGFNWLKTDSLDYYYENGPTNPDALLGLPQPFGVGQAFGDPGLPDINGGSSFSENESGDNWIQDDRTYQVYDQISWTKNKHSFMAGVDFRRLNIGRAAVNSARGILNFSNSSTSYTNAASIPAGCTNALCTYGASDASFYLGVMTGDTTPLDQVKEEVTQWRDGFFVQDTWQYSKKLTLELGLRYELPQVATSANGFAVQMDPTYSFLVPASTATTPQTYKPDVGYPLTLPNHKDIGPHLGFAYRVTDKIVIRGGGGIYYNANQMNAFTLDSSNYPFAASSNYSSPANGQQTAANPYVTLSSPTSGAGGTLPVPGPPSATNPGYIGAYSVNNVLPSETMYQWNLDNGIELWKNAGLELQYTGSHQIHLNTNLYPNQPIPGVGNQALSVNARRPNQSFGQIRVADNIATATYEGLTTVFRQRLTHGLSANVSYTWSHNLDESAQANGSGSATWQGHLKMDYGNSSADVRNKVVTSFVYALPSLARSNFLVQELIGGWQVNGIVTVQSGAPFNVTISNDWVNVGEPAQPQRMNWVHVGHQNCTKATLLQAAYGTSISCVDPTAYAPPARFTYGNAHRDDLYGPSSWSNNLSVFKNFKIHEQVNFQFRVEGFNALNHANVGAPGSVGFNITANSTVVGSPGYFTGTALPASSVFGTTSASGAGRTVQIAGKINF